MGEKEFLKELGATLHPGTGLEWRNDCIVAPLPLGANLVYSIDRPVQIFSTGNREHDLRCFGRWSAGVVANDVIACGVEPKGISFDIGLEECGPDAIPLWARGVLDVCDKYGMKYEGGNLGDGRGVTGVCWGLHSKGNIIRRRGACDGAVLLATCLVGIGWSIRLWRDAGGEESRLGPLSRYQDEPWVNLDAFREVWSLGCILSGMDLTDGIVEFGYEVLEQDGLGVCFDPERSVPSPVDFVFDELGLPQRTMFFEPGYDTPFAHGWCIEPSSLESVKTILKRFNVPFTVLGRVTAALDGVYVAMERGPMRPLPRYWDDKLATRGSIAQWKSDILPVFCNQ